MGAEYKLTVNPLKAEAFDRALRAHRGFAGYDAERKVYTFNDPGSPASIPVAKVALVPGGLLFEDLLSKPLEASHIFRALVDVAVMSDASVRIEDA